jgi:hypothetical protein
VSYETPTKVPLPFPVQTQSLPLVSSETRSGTPSPVMSATINARVVPDA